MTADNFTDAARAEAERKHPVPASYDPGVSQYERLLAQGAFRNGAEWARAHLAAQEPTEDEVLAVARLFYRTQCGHDLLDGSVYKDRWMNTARAALSAARTARRDGETR